MSEFQNPAHDPRWGAENRNLKAEQIFQTLQQASTRDLSSAQWLDMGCGSGGIAAHLAPQVSQMIGVDPEPWVRWADWAQAHANLKFIQASVDTLALPPASVDVIICNQVYEHVPDPQALIRLIHHMLKPGGLVYFAGPNLLFPIEPHVFWPFVHWLPRTFAIRLMKALGSKHADDLDAYSTHYWQLTDWLASEFTVNNALPVVVKQIIPKLKDGWPYQLLRAVPSWLINLLTPLSPGFVFVLEKPA